MSIPNWFRLDIYKDCRPPISPLAPAMRELLFTHLMSGVVAHQIFRRCEPRSPLSHLGLCLLLPLALSTFVSWRLSCPFRPRSAVIDHVIALLCSTIAYRLSPMHPLAVYPGPIACRVTQIRSLSALQGGKYAQWLIHLHQQYGTHVRVGEPACKDRLRLSCRRCKGPNDISISDLDALPMLLNSAAFGKAESEPNKFIKLGASSIIHLALSDYAALQMPGQAPLIFAEIHNETRMARRKVWTRAMGLVALREFVPMMDRRVQQFSDVLMQHSDVGTPLDISGLFTHLACVQLSSLEVALVEILSDSILSAILGAQDFHWVRTWLIEPPVGLEEGLKP